MVRQDAATTPEEFCSSPFHRHGCVLSRPHPREDAHIRAYFSTLFEVQRGLDPAGSERAKWAIESSSPAWGQIHKHFITSPSRIKDPLGLCRPPHAVRSLLCWPGLQALLQVPLCYERSVAPRPRALAFQRLFSRFEMQCRWGLRRCSKRDLLSKAGVWRGLKQAVHHHHMGLARRGYVANIQPGGCLQHGANASQHHASPRPPGMPIGPRGRRGDPWLSPLTGRWFHPAGRHLHPNPRCFAHHTAEEPMLSSKDSCAHRPPDTSTPAALRRQKPCRIPAGWSASDRHHSADASCNQSASQHGPVRPGGRRPSVTYRPWHRATSWPHAAASRNAMISAWPPARR